MTPTQREDMTAAILDATIPLRERIAELEKELEVVSESEASLLTESINVCNALGIDTSGDYNVVACVQQLRADLKEAQHEARVLRLRCANYAQLEEQFQAMRAELGRMRSRVIDCATVADQRKT